jgi:hypothetical protein
MRSESFSFFFLLLSSVALVAGMGLFATSQTQEASIQADVDRFTMVVHEPYRWLEWPSFTVMATGAVLGVIAIEPDGSRHSVRSHFILFVLLLGAFFVFLPANLGIGAIFTEPQTNDMRSWVSYGFLGPMGTTPLSLDAHYSLLAYAMVFGITFGASLVGWSMFKPKEYRAFFGGLRSRFLPEKSTKAG